MTKFEKYKKDIKKAIEKDNEEDIGMILSSAEPKQRDKLRSYARMYKVKQKDKEMKELNKYKIRIKNDKQKRTGKITRALYDSRKRKTKKSAKGILKAFRLA